MRIGRSSSPGSDVWAILPGYGLVLWVLAAVVCALLPLPRWLVDLLLTASLAASVAALVASVTVKRSTELPEFPRLLLLMTLTRMALNVTTTRLILSDADAGEVIAAFATLVIQGDLLVGAVVFAIVTVVQFVVVARGGERIAEVAARFALDGLPGHQAAIEADLRSGVVSPAEAARQRARLRERSSFHGAMDGAAKFIRGDAILGLALTSINVVGGVTVGLRDGLGLGASLELYGRLAIGDGLLAQVPALLMGLAGALLVARVEREEPLARRATWLTPGIVAAPAGLLAGLALVPGMPGAAFLITATGLAGLALALRRARARSRTERRIVVCLPGHDLRDIQALRRPLAELRRRCAAALGIDVPPIAAAPGPCFSVRLAGRELSVPEDINREPGASRRGAGANVRAREELAVVVPLVGAGESDEGRLGGRSLGGTGSSARAGESDERLGRGSPGEVPLAGVGGDDEGRLGRGSLGGTSPLAGAGGESDEERLERGAQGVTGPFAKAGSEGDGGSLGRGAPRGTGPFARSEGESDEGWLGGRLGRGSLRDVSRDMIDGTGPIKPVSQDMVVMATFRAVMRHAEVLVDLRAVAAALEQARAREPAVTREALQVVGPADLLELARGLLRERVPLPPFTALLEAVASEPALRQASERGRWLGALRERLAPHWLPEVVAAHARLGPLSWTRPVADAEAALLQRAVHGERGLRLAIDPRGRLAWRSQALASPRNDVARANGGADGELPPIVVCSPRARPVFALLLARGAPHVSVLSTAELQEVELPVPGEPDGPPARWFEAPGEAGGGSRGRTLPGLRDTA